MARFRKTLGWISVAAVTLALGGSAVAGGNPAAGDLRSFPWRAKNVILVIGDGMGDSEITLARNYTVGAAGELALDRLPYTGQMTTFSVQETDPSIPDYTSESASTASAWSTGQKTADGRISTSPSTDQDLTTFLEIAQDRGMKTGVVSTADITDATNAAAMSHVAARGCQGPADMASCPQDAKENGGPGSIAEQAIDHEVDVLLGGGLSRFEQTITGGPDAGLTVLDSAAAKGYEFVGTRDDLLASDGTKLLGLFTPSHMSVDWAGAVAANPPSGPQRCTEDQRPANEPSLAEMTTKAIEALTHRSRAGFFLQVESASIDKRDHVSQPCEQIGETVALDEAIAVVLEFARTSPGTLVIVTADHAHTSQITEVDAAPAGFSSILLTDEGGEMLVTYGTGSTPEGQQHTGSQVRVAAAGPQGWKVVGLIDQTELFDIMERAIGAS
jgi:alkaline phosphatase